MGLGRPQKVILVVLFLDYVSSPHLTGWWRPTQSSGGTADPARFYKLPTNCVLTVGGSCCHQEASEPSVWGLAFIKKTADRQEKRSEFTQSVTFRVPKPLWSPL